jgi:hypothetical protein
MNRTALTYVLIVILSLVLVGLLGWIWNDRRRPLPPRTGKQIMVIKNYNYAGGYFWSMYNVLLASHWARRKGMGFLIMMDSGLYLENNVDRVPRHVPHKERNEWFSYYFKTNDKLFAQYCKDKPHLHSFSDYDAASDRVWYEWDRGAFNKHINDLETLDHKLEWDENMGSKLLPHVQKRFDDAWVTAHGMNQCYVIGVHLRGSDKFANRNDSEDGPVHYEYSFVAKLLEEQCDVARRITTKQVKVFVASDEQPFIEYLKENFKACDLVFNNCIRSSVNTSGLKIDSHLCGDEPAIKGPFENPDCITYWNMAYQSVHRGHRELSSYLKGEDVLVDVLMLSRCDCLLRSAGNVSNFPKYINPDLIVVNMVTEYGKR